MRKVFDIACLGEALVEFNQSPSGEYRRGFGGDTSNCAIAAARLGARAAYITQIGDDGFGGDLMSLWAEERVDTVGVRAEAGSETGIYFVSHGPSGHRFSYRRARSAASRMTPESLPADVIERARWLHVSGVSQAISQSACDAVFAAAGRARAAGTMISYDLNYREALWPRARAVAILRATLAQCDLFLPSVDEMAYLTGIADVRGILQWSHDHGARQVALKLGAKGSVVSDGHQHWAIEPHTVQPVDSTGAGDCFAGALLARLASGDALPDAARVASIASALSTTGIGAVAPLPRWADIEGLLH